MGLGKTTLKVLAILIGLVVIASACGRADDSIETVVETVGEASGGDEAPTSDCSAATETEIGVTADTITILAMADVGSPLSPGLFQGAFDGTSAWVDYVNSQGGLACRQIELVQWDSKLSPVESTNGYLEACDNAVAMVGSNALFVLNTEALDTCEDMAGNPTGIPDFAEGAAEINHHCSDNVIVIFGVQGTCPYDGEGERLYEVQRGQTRYLNSVYGTLSCVYAIPSDIRSTILLVMPGIRASGLYSGTRNDGERGISGAATQAEYAELLSLMRDNDSQCASNSSADGGLIKWRSEAVAQGGFDDVIWSCFFQCYTKLLRESDVTEGTYLWLTFLPFEERDTNAELDLFLSEIDSDSPNVWAVAAWASGRLFEQVINSVVEKNGINGITRQNILNETKNVQDFDANGMLGKISFGEKPNLTNCIIVVQVQNNEFVRVHPEERGTFHCEEENNAFILIDPLRAYNEGLSYTGSIP